MTEPLDRLGVYARLRAAVKAAGDQKTYAHQIGVSPAYLSDVLNARREPGDSILAALGLRKMVRYVEARTTSAALSPADRLAPVTGSLPSSTNLAGVHQGAGLSGGKA